MVLPTQISAIDAAGRFGGTGGDVPLGEGVSTYPAANR
jgi:hypothetical protein